MTLLNKLLGQNISEETIDNWSPPGQADGRSRTFEVKLDFQIQQDMLVDACDPRTPEMEAGVWRGSDALF